MRKSARILFVMLVMTAGLGVASALQAQDRPDGMMKRDDMMNMMTQMSKMMEHCSQMMQRANESPAPGDQHRGPDVPSMPKKG